MAAYLKLIQIIQSASLCIRTEKLEDDQRTEAPILRKKGWERRGDVQPEEEKGPGILFFNFPILRGDIKKGESDFFL